MSGHLVPSLSEDVLMMGTYPGGETHSPTPTSGSPDAFPMRHARPQPRRSLYIDQTLRICFPIISHLNQHARPFIDALPRQALARAIASPSYIGAHAASPTAGSTYPSRLMRPQPSLHRAHARCIPDYAVKVIDHCRRGISAPHLGYGASPTVGPAFLDMGTSSHTPRLDLSHRSPSPDALSSGALGAPQGTPPQFSTSPESTPWTLGILGQTAEPSSAS
ncbi:hypothetical protein AURDEDRAFT_164395 [Auricularia subglabra TFB-10046 SS5]|nr:hypothetical protein AURDEDRAFT_164395 [Auricularia subglabra TFB-10046 SS5]